ncbi:MAG: formate--tetrahydrofolate ligase [Candidatus Omnitrophica bacterium]|nr:formate--tetrahydrofolate ligase [Candidatus Omnitrophota bacterium]
MKTDLDIAHSIALRPIRDIAAAIGIEDQELEPYGHYKAKINLSILNRLTEKNNGKYVVVTAITPTPLGEGKTLTTIGLSLGLNRAGSRAIACIRQPSLGPVFGIKGGAAGGGYSQVLPMEDVNLHLTGDAHAVGVAHNLCAAFLPNPISKNNPPRIDPQRVTWRRVIGVSDRFLRDVVIGLGGEDNGFLRQTGFDIIEASEVMAILALADGIPDLRKRLGRIFLGTTYDGKPVTPDDIAVGGAMAALLKDAIKPNLLQTTEGTACFVHTGPFGNIAHGNSSLLADKIARKLADFTVTESGFGADCGFEKFMDIKCRAGGMLPDCAVLVCSVRALKMHSGRFSVVAGRPLDPGLLAENLAAVSEGAANLEKQIENVRCFGVPVVVAINRFSTDTDAEINSVRERALACGAAAAAVCTAHAEGGRGAEQLAEAVRQTCTQNNCSPQLLYPPEMPLKEKIIRIAQTIYGADGVDFHPVAENKLKQYTDLGYGTLPICMAKTHLSLSHDPALKGKPRNFTLPVMDVRLSAGAGFVYPLCGKMRTMPGLPSVPCGSAIDITDDGSITGLS